MGKAKTPASVASVKSLDWPALPFPRDDLALETILEDQIILIHELFSAKDALRWTTFFNTLPLQPSPAAKRGEAHRTNDRFSIQDPKFAKSLWEETALSKLFKYYPSSRNSSHRATALNPNIRIYAYSPGQMFRQHYDDEVTDPLSGLKSEWTLLIYLTGIEDGVQGGETAFRTNEGKDIVVGLNRGTALLHRHGRDCLLHEGKEVKGGVKWVLRSDVLFGPSS